MMNGQVVKSGANKGCINFGIVQPDSREARIYPVADELLATVHGFVAEIEKLTQLAPKLVDQVDESLIKRAHDLMKAAIG